MTNRYDLLTTRKDRDGKNRYTKVGTMFPRKEGDGFSMKFDSLPLPNEQGEVWVSAYPPRESDAGGGAPRGRAPAGGSASRPLAEALDDSIPFAPEVRG